MAGSFSSYLQSALLEHLFDQASFSIPDIYVSLHVSTPGESGWGELFFTDGYARVYTYFDDWLLTASGMIQNYAEIAFPMATGYWSYVSYFGLWDNATSGNFLLYGLISPSMEIMYGDVARFEPYALTVTLD